MSASKVDAKSLLGGLMDVMDNLERAVNEDAGQSTAVSDGVRAIHKQMGDLLYKHGVRSFNAVGQPFNANFHEAVGNIYSDSLPPKHVARVLSNGYYIHEQLFRPARVIVSTDRKQQDEDGWQDRRTKSTEVQERSSVNRPGWLMQAPANTREFRFFIGKSTEYEDLEKGKAAARDTILGELIKHLAKEESFRYRAAYVPLADALTSKLLQGSWERMASQHKLIRKIQEDCFWERVSSEISGTVYNVAILMAIPAVIYDSLLRTHGKEDRWAGMELIDPGPFVGALIKDGAGGLIYELRERTMAERAGLVPGDIITQVGNLPARDAVSTRRLLGRMASSKPMFPVHYLRTFVEAPPTNIVKRGHGSGRGR